MTWWIVEIAVLLVSPFAWIKPVALFRYMSLTGSPCSLDHAQASCAGISNEIPDLIVIEPDRPDGGHQRQQHVHPHQCCGGPAPRLIEASEQQARLTAATEQAQIAREMHGTNGIEATRPIVASGSHALVLVLTTFDFDEYAFVVLREGGKRGLVQGRQTRRSGRGDPVDGLRRCSCLAPGDPTDVGDTLRSDIQGRSDVADR